MLCCYIVLNILDLEKVLNFQQISENRYCHIELWSSTFKIFPLDPELYKCEVMHSLNWLQVNGKINFKTNSRNMNASGTSGIRQFKIFILRSGSPAIPPLLKNIHSIKREESIIPSPFGGGESCCKVVFLFSIITLDLLVLIYFDHREQMCFYSADSDL